MYIFPLLVDFCTLNKQIDLFSVTLLQNTVKLSVKLLEGVSYVAQMSDADVVTIDSPCDHMHTSAFGVAEL